MKYVIVSGTLSGGFIVEGPFDGFQAAAEYANSNYADDKRTMFEIAELLEPARAEEEPEAKAILSLDEAMESLDKLGIKLTD